MEDLQVLVESSVVRSEHNQYTPGCVHFPSHLDYWMCPVLFLRTYTHYTFIYLASHMPLHLNDSLTRKKTQARMLFLGVVALTVFHFIQGKKRDIAELPQHSFADLYHTSLGVRTSGGTLAEMSGTKQSFPFFL
ncbi:hypothetical protein Y032_0043g828 [Ancylostoma ceylanicum]|uniref:Uncharacterized protein n=1 Tax=Ancylostoma ceylanicum TaxID=53326 RepID=A0A016UGB8_9BILA|nr:hypothetical protein Y032_0043g828 [Ancylostoma ceylanicum]